jgi:phosphopantetheinyl transferase
MPIYHQWQQGAHLKAAIWKIEESEAFFNVATGLTTDKKFEHKRLEYLSCRYLLSLLAPEIILSHIVATPLGKPYVPESDLQFSLSHSYPFVAAAVNYKGHVGIDIQRKENKIVRLQHKFLSDQEQALCQNDVQLLNLAWTAKEATFKHYGLGAVDFIQHMPIEAMELTDDKASVLIQFNKPEIQYPQNLHGGVDEDFAWSVTI